MSPATPSTIRLTAQTPLLEDLLGEMRSGRVRVPPFQRLYRWDEKDVLRLLDSIDRGYPIGTLLLWRRPAAEGEVDYGPVRVHAPARDDAWWVVDGQQRLISLAAVLLPDALPSDRRFALFYDLASGTLTRTRAAARQPDESWLPLHLALDTTRLLDWLLAYPLREEEPEHQERALSFAKRLREYRVPTYVVEGAGEDELRNIFDRTNRGGRPLRSAEVFDALHGREDAGAHQTLRGLAEELASMRFGRLDEGILLRSLLATRGPDPFRDLDNEFDGAQDRANAFAVAAHALTAAIEHLHDDCGFPHQSVVPYKLVVPVLARFFHLHPAPAPRSRELLRRWVWRGAIAGVQAGGFTAALRQAAQAVGDDEHAAVARLLDQVPSRSERRPDLAAPRLNTAAGRLAFACLWTCGPLDPETGEPVDADRLVTEGVAQVTGSIAASDPSALADRVLVPARGGVERELVKAGDDVRASLAVGERAVVALKRRDAAGFLARRGEDLLGLQSRVWDEHAAWGESDRPPIDALVVADA